MGDSLSPEHGDEEGGDCYGSDATCFGSMPARTSPGSVATVSFSAWANFADAGSEVVLGGNNSREENFFNQYCVLLLPLSHRRLVVSLLEAIEASRGRSSEKHAFEVRDSWTTGAQGKVD